MGCKSLSRVAPIAPLIAFAEVEALHYCRSIMCTSVLLLPLSVLLHRSALTGRKGNGTKVQKREKVQARPEEDASVLVRCNGICSTFSLKTDHFLK